MTLITRYNPFPFGFKGDEKNGAYGEKEINKGNSFRFVVVMPRSYMKNKEREEFLVSNGVRRWEDIYPEILSLGYMPDPEKVFWLYNVYICEIEKKYLACSDSEVFAKNAKNCEEYVFDNFDSCMNFIESKYGLYRVDFTKLWESNYPRY